ncbi:hypothetical protein BCR42DRAFT_412045 [Absidia repens]|uniref:Integral membrane protein n=1 Tax=Absidia repens TaxID=90262 RepID=A0A1X2IML0_9FUNG|nr:hypothetical protein BCR42DRAFT_412045 [Absidia repens]
MPSNTRSGPTSSTVSILMIGMLVSGVCNTILNKYQDMQCVGNCEDPDPTQRRYFEQPVWQTLNMFVGETFVWAVYLYQKWQQRRSRTMTSLSSADYPPSTVQQLDASGLVDDVVDHSFKDHPSSTLPALKGFKALLFWIPTICDLTATTLMNVGLILTSASVYQMLRGAVVIFTGLFSYLFLNRRLRAFEWFSLVCVVLGVAVVGLSSVLFPQARPSDGVEKLATDVDWQSFAGVLLILGAQIFTATQFVVEEKILAHYHVTPLEAVGLEGSFGVISVLGSLPILHVLFRDQTDYFDMVQGFHDFFDHPGVWQTGIAISISIAFFNWFGLTMTHTVSATARSTIDASRTFFIWMVSIYLGWEMFSWIQVVGFIIMVTGTSYFNGVLRWPFASDSERSENDGETQPLLSSSD